MKNAILVYLEQCPPALELFRRLTSAGHVYLIGGVLREYLDHQCIESLRDIDIIIDVQNTDLWGSILCDYSFSTNRFGGNKLICSGLLLDVWPIETTWAFRSGVIQCSPKEYIKNLPLTVFLNIDSVIYDWDNESWFDSIYRKAMETRILDIVLADNPQLLLNIVRAIVLKRRYQMSFSDPLQKVVLNCYQDLMNLSAFCKALYDEQIRRYQAPVLSKEELYDEACALLKFS